MGARFLTAALAAGALVLGAATPAHGAAHLPPQGKVLWGGAGGYDASDIADFGRRSGRAPAVYQFFVDWQAGRWLEGRLEHARSQGARPMLHIEPGGLSPGAIARGAGDGYLVDLNRLLARFGDVVYLRPLSEMNNSENPYSPRAPSGSSRGRAYSAGAFRAAWRRMVTIVRGGSAGEVAARLRRLRQPPLAGGARDLARPQVAFQWVPLSFGNPETPANHPRHFYPGARFVDWVGTTWYSPYRNSSAMDRFMRHPKWRRKPFVFAEWGVWGADTADFVGQFFGFMRSHPRVRMAVYYQSALLKPEFRLSTHPRTSRALQRATRWRRLAGAG